MSLDPKSRLLPLPKERPRSRSERACRRSSSRSSSRLRPRRRQLPERVHLPAAAASSRSCGRRRAARPASGSWRGTRTCRCVAGWRSAAAAAPAGRRISAMYPVVELVTGALFVGGYLLYGGTPLWFVRIAFACAMIVLFVIDLQHHILPNVITVPGIPIGFALSLFLPPGWRSRSSACCWAAACSVRDRRGLLPAARHRRARHGRREDAGDDRRVPRLAADAGDAHLRVVHRRAGRRWRCWRRAAAA